MFSKYMRRVTNHDCPVVLSITSTTTETQVDTVIHRNNIDQKDGTRHDTGDIYVRAREIYYRARRQRPVRAASIF